ncbi:hypothetical protein SASPL_110198 [Salvia splendens]|uniref:Isopenicillin N synthase-like Fe(2+) 2OG dioxygenase domain-containing protein n=1 Tax=Salvia splendens TaxID=180675 RepID=A0A8X8Y474_SALSN|nr:hypothetical protein SASPL_110198 [Salvia splendens]
MSCVSTKLPLIDLSNLGENDSPRWESTEIQILEALQEYGGFEATYINLIPLELRKSVGDGIRQLFDLSLATKLLNKNPHIPLHSYVSRNDSDALVESIVIDGALSPHVVETSPTSCGPIKAIPLPDCEANGVGESLTRKIHRRTYQLHRLLLSCPEIISKDGKTWIPADPTSLDSIIVMVGTTLRAWTNGRLHDPFHRVVVSGDETRYTIGLVTVAKEGCVIKTPEELVNEDHPLLYKPFDYYKFINFTTTDAGRASPDPLKEYCEA